MITCKVSYILETPVQCIHEYKLEEDMDSQTNDTDDDVRSYTILYQINKTISIVSISENIKSSDTPMNFQPIYLRNTIFSYCGIQEQKLKIIKMLLYKQS